jgi:hypothetical protein
MYFQWEGLCTRSTDFRPQWLKRHVSAAATKQLGQKNQEPPNPPIVTLNTLLTSNALSLGKSLAENQHNINNIRGPHKCPN